ncbi:MAG TPA: hypothetical protein PKE26_07970 [Kiritimatiellia bacterium]|nr:hypothetical protein [Kiritimatiellia bacterium]HMO99029.1 hypothetical protein [Kiritimatiellia bacterium]HMP96105.1 hypothetical protein [Kiritimatiellia bacterium]
MNARNLNKKSWIAGLALAGFVIMGATAFADTPRPLKVVAWNIEWFPGVKMYPTPKQEAEHMKAAQKALREIDPDIFIGQEIRDWKSFDELVSAVPGLKTHVVSSFLLSTTREIGRQQIGIASKLSCQHAWAEAFEATVPRTSRGFAFTALDDPHGRGLILVYGVHLKSNVGGTSDAMARINGSVRNDQARQILSHMADMAMAFGDRPIRGWLIGGDINTNHDNQFPYCRVVDMVETMGFLNTWRGVPRAERLTWRSDTDSVFEPTTLDYIFLRGFGQRVRASIIEVPRPLSDHYPIMVELP